jgi:hypothetical protein
MNPCLKTGITVATDDGQFIHGDLFLNEFGVQVRGAGPLMVNTGRPSEAVVRVKSVSNRGGWIDYTVDMVSITEGLALNLDKWSHEALEFFLESGAEIVE